MIPRASSAAAIALLHLILALSFECLLSSPTPDSNQQFANRNHVPPKPQYQNSPQQPAPLSQPSLPQQQQQRASINRVFPPQHSPPFADGSQNQQLRQPAPRGNSRHEAQQASQLDFAQRISGKLNSNDVRSMSLDGVSFKNHPPPTKLDNNKSVDTLSRMGASGRGSSGPEESHVGGMEEKKKATPEQKELKRKLIELADKATSTPADLMRFNEATQTFEPLGHDPSARRKLLDAMKALSSRRLPAERLRKALEDDYDEAGSEFEASDSSSDSVSDSSSESGSELGDSGSMSLSPDYVDSSYYESSWPNQVVGRGGDEEPYESSHTSYHRDASESDREFYEQTSHEQEFGHQPGETPEESLSFAPSSGYHAGSGHQGVETPSFQYADRGVEEDDLEEERERVATAASEPAAEFVEMNHEVAVDETLDEVRDMLGDRLGRLTDLLYFRPEVLNQLLRLSDHRLTPIEREFKRMVLCNSDERFCNRDLSNCPLGPNEFSTVPPADKFVSDTHHYEQRGVEEPEERLICETGPADDAAGSYDGNFREAQPRGAQVSEPVDEERRNLLGQAARNLEQSFEQRRLEPHGGQSRADTLPFLQSQTQTATSRRGLGPSTGYRHSQSKAFYAYRQAHETSVPAPSRNVPETGPRERSSWVQSESVNGVPTLGDSSRLADQYSPRQNEQHHNHHQHHQANENFLASQHYATASPSGANHRAAGPHPFPRPAQQQPPFDHNKVQPQPMPVVSRGVPSAQPVHSPGQQPHARPQPVRPDSRPQQQQHQMPSTGQQPVRSQLPQGQAPRMSLDRNNFRPSVEVNRAQSPLIETVQTRPVESATHSIGGQPHRLPVPDGAHPFDVINKPRQAGPVASNVNTHKRN